MSKTPSHPSRFASLPAELRNKIYAHAIAALPTSTIKTTEVRIGHPAVAAHHPDAYKSEPGLALTQTSRQIRSEYLAMYAYQSRVTFSIWKEGELRACLKWLATFGEIRIPLTRRIYVSGKRSTCVIDFNDVDKTCELSVRAEGHHEDLTAELEALKDAIVRGMKRSEDGSLRITKEVLEYVLRTAFEKFEKPSQQRRDVMRQCGYLSETIRCTSAEKDRAAQAIEKAVEDGMLGCSPGFLSAILGF